MAVGLPQRPGGVGGRVGGQLLGPGQVGGQELLALGQGMGVGGHLGDLVDGDPGPGHQVEMDVHHHLALDVEVDVEDEPVDGGAHRALDGVLHGHEAQVDRAVGHRFEDAGDGPVGAQIGRGQVSLGQQRLLGEGGRRAEVGHRGRRRVHTRAG